MQVNYLILNKGKTTGLTFLREKLTELGYNVMTVPEAATLIFNGGGFLSADKWKESETITF